MADTSRLRQEETAPNSVPRPRARLSFMGGPRAWTTEQGEGPLANKQTWRVLAYLALKHGRPVARDELAEVLWAEDLPPTWEAALRGVVKKVRDLLTELGLDGTQAVRTLSGGYELDLPAEVEVDTDRLRAAFTRSERAFRDDRFADALTDAVVVRSSGGEFLPAEDGAWIEAERAELRRMRLRALEIESDAARETGDFAGAVRAAEDAVALEPLDEKAYRALIEAHEAAGDRAQALNAYERCRRTLTDELGVDPSPETQTLKMRVLAAEGPVEVAARPVLPGALRPGRTPFVGRASELERLRSELQVARAGTLRLLVIAGDPGVGKSQLMAEFARGAYEEGSTVLYGRCDEDPIGSYQPFVEALSRLRNVGAGDTPIPDELAKLIPGLDTGTAQTVETFGADTNALRFRMFEGVANLLTGGIVHEAGLVLVLDDLHWADRPTLLLLEHIIRSKVQAPVLIVGTYRGGEAPQALVDTLADVRRNNVLTELRLDGLDVAETEALIEGWGDATTTGFARAVHERTDGNPLFTLEVLRHLREGTVEIDLQGGHLEGVGIPPGIRDVIRRRVSRLSQGAQDSLLMASVVGRHFDLQLIERLVPADLDVPLALEEASAAGVVAELPDSIGQFRFAHDLVRQVLYGGLSPTRRARLHLRCGEALEEVLGNRPETRVSELAHHFTISAPVGNRDKAIRYCELAGDRAIALLAFEEAVEHYQRALDFAPENDDETRARLLISIADAQGRSGEMQMAWRTLAEALPCAERAGSLEQLGEALVRATSFLASNWDQEAWDIGNQGLARLGDEDSVVRSVLLSRLALTTQSFGAPPEVTQQTVRLSVEAHDMACRLGDPVALSAALQARLLCDPAPSLLPKRLDLIHQLVSLSAETGDDPLLMNSYMWLGMELLARGELAEAQASMEEFDRLGAATGHPWAGWRLMVSRGTWAIMRGDLASAEEILQRALEVGSAAGVPQAMLYYAGQLYLLRLEQGRLAEIEQALLAFGGGSRELEGFEALLYAEVGRLEDAHALLVRLAQDRFSCIPLTYPGWWIGTYFLSFVCDVVGDAEVAHVLIDHLSPYEGRHLVLGGFGGYWGPADLALGGLAATLGQRHRAKRHFERALAMCKAVETPPWEARTQLRFGRFLLDEDRPLATKLLRDAAATAERIGMRGIAGQASALIEGMPP